MARLLKYLAISCGLLGLLGIGYIGYLRIMHRIECPTTKRITPIVIPRYPQITQIITDETEAYAAGERGKQVFITTDTPAAVVAFYRTSLDVQGWREVRDGTDHRGYQLVEFRETQFLPVYFLNLYTIANQDGTTVEVFSGSNQTSCLVR